MLQHIASGLFKVLLIRCFQANFMDSARMGQYGLGGHSIGGISKPRTLTGRALNYILGQPVHEGLCLDLMLIGAPCIEIILLPYSCTNWMIYAKF
jgi:hypothetical protein